MPSGQVDVLPPPCDIGAPSRYTRWRDMQSQAAIAAIDSTKRFVVQGAPTGFGKSLVYISQALLTGRTCILTSTKALQAQLLTDFKESGLIEIKGMNAYECIEGRPTGKFGDYRREGFRADKGLPMMCDEAPCQSGAWCDKRKGGCLYYDANAAAGNMGSRLVVTNYAYWMSIHRYGEGLGIFDLLVMDEAHNALDELGGFIGTELRPSEVESLLPEEARVPPATAVMKDWQDWGEYWNMYTLGLIEALRLEIKENERSGNSKLNHGKLRQSRDLKRLQHKLQTIAHMSGDWIIDWTEEGSHRRPLIKFDPVWPGSYAENTLFLGVPKVVMVSATVRPKTAHMLDIKPADIEFKEYPSTFPKASRPVLYIPTGHMNAKSEAASMPDMSTRVDQVIARRLDRKGIIHTVSYRRALAFYNGSKYKDMLLMHDSSDTRDKIETFRKSRRPLVLISPVMDTGYDFPYTDAEYQIIVKVPFPPAKDKVIEARNKRDREYKDYVTMVTLVQMAGRICRANDDVGETIILDSDFGWWFDKYGRKLAPRWFVESVNRAQFLSAPLPKLEGAYVR